MIAKDLNRADPVEAVLDTLRTTEVHVDSEYIDDHAATLASVSKEPRYGMMPEPGVVSVVSDTAGVEQFYERARQAFLPYASRMVAQIATDWYVFYENVPTRITVPTGQARTLHTVTLFPKAPDGIRGEFLWERAAASHGATSSHVESAAGSIPEIAVRNLEIHERLLGALGVGEIDRIIEMFDVRCICAVRNYAADSTALPMLKLQGPAEVRASLVRWLETYDLERVSILNRMATDWYVFAEELLVVRPKDGPKRGERMQYRKASIYPIASTGRLEGELGFGTDLEEASPASTRTLGAAFWVRREQGQALDPHLARRSDAVAGK